jgi:hypothetical protein
LGGNGGIGVYLATSATLANSGTIIGGGGGEGDYGANSGAGVKAAAEDVVNNTGIVIGGVGGIYGYSLTKIKYGKYGGTGIALYDGSTLNNSGQVIGGAGLHSFNYKFGGSGGFGVYLSDATGTNTGTISGGAAGYGQNGGRGGDGANVKDDAVLINKASITGGAGAHEKNSYSRTGDGGTGVNISAYGTVTNTGHITGGAGSASVYTNGRAAFGGDGVDISAGRFTNNGTVTGGAGGAAFGDPPPSSGTAQAPGGTGTGGDGLDTLNYGVIDSAFSIVNYGLIQGGNSGYLSGFGGNAAAGGRGVALDGATLTNKGNIKGGTGSFTGTDAAHYPATDIAGIGGAGAEVGVGGLLINSGRITGGNGGATFFTGAEGGAGVTLAGGTLVTSGTITGGTGGTSQSNGARGDAVDVYGAYASTVILNPGALFNGNVVASGFANNVLELAGSSTGTLQGIGTKFIGFKTIEFAAGATRSIEGTISGFSVVTGLAPHDSIIIDGFTTDLSKTSITGAGIVLNNGSPTVLKISQAQANNILITDAGSKTTIAPVLGTFVHTLATGMEQFVLSGSTSTSVLKSGGVEEIYSGGIAAKTTIAGGELELQVGAKITSGVTFSSGGGELKIDSSVMPAATISGFIHGDTIDLAGVAYNKYDTVTVKTAGIVSVVTPDKTYNLNIAGATVGEKDFVFGAGSLLTKNAAMVPKMQFIAPDGNAQISSYWLGAPANVTAPITAEPAEPVAAFTTISAQSTGVGFTDLHDSIQRVSLATWLPHG